MKVENITGYGKGFVDSLTSPEAKIINRIQMKVIRKVLFKELGLIRTVKLGWKVYRENKKMKLHDWSFIEKQGCSKNALQILLYPILLMKVLANTEGMERAQEIASDMLDKTEEDFVKKNLGFNSFGIPINELKTCKDSYKSFTRWLKASHEPFEKDGIHKIEIENHSEDTFAFNMTYCAANEIAIKCGNSAFCFPWCYLDDATFPNVGVQLGFKFERPEKLASGASKCNFCFTRI